MRIPVLLLVLAALLPAQESKTSTVRATGEAVLMVQPDLARIDVGVVSEAATAQAAAAQNAKQLTAVLAELKKAAGPDAQIETLNYWVNPKYRHGEGRAPVIVGYTATNAVRVIVSDLAKVSTIIDTATKSGANTIQGVHFTLKDENAARARALEPAARQARSNAESIASSLGLKVIRVVSAEEGQPTSVRPFQERMMMAQTAMAEAVPTPVEPRSIEVRATVTVTLEVVPIIARP
jgi:uncharacterized protein YggE